MYVDSYRKKYPTTTIEGYEYAYSSTQAYKYVENGSTVRYTSQNSIELDAMYSRTTASGYWWLASPSVYHEGVVCLVDCDIRRFNRGADNYPYGVCPLVCLKSGVVLQVQ